MQKGFTLIELIITIAIVGVLAAIATFQYQVYIARAQMTEVITKAQEYKFAVNHYYSETNEFPLSNADIKIDDNSTKYIEYIQLNNKKILFKLKKIGISYAIQSGIVQLTPFINEDNNLTWVCTSTLTTKYLPSECTTHD